MVLRKSYDQYTLIHKNRDQSFQERVGVKFCLKTAKSSAETCNLSKIAFEDKCLRQSNVFMWFNKFGSDQESVEDGAQSGKPPISITNENIAKIHFVRSDRRLTIREIADKCNLNFYAIWLMFIEYLNMQRVDTKLLLDNQNKHRL